MAFALSGVPNAVATCGTALADDHFQIIKNLARKVMLAYDADAAGQGAAERWYEWEQRYDIQLEVADLPPGRDPADVWRDDPQLLVEGGRGGEAVPGVPHRPRARGGRQVQPRRPRPCRGGRRRDHRRASERSRARPVRDAGRGRARHRRRSPARPRWARAPRAGRGARARRHGASRHRRRQARARRVDRREVDLLLYAVHDPALVEEWLDARAVRRPGRRARRSRPSTTPTTSTTRSTRDRRPRARSARTRRGGGARATTTSPRRCTSASWRTRSGPQRSAWFPECSARATNDRAR